jgi:hypothetical protein
MTGGFAPPPFDGFALTRERVKPADVDPASCRGLQTYPFGDKLHPTRPQRMVQVGYRAGTFRSLTDTACACIPGNRPFPTALDPFTSELTHQFRTNTRNEKLRFDPTAFQVRLPTAFQLVRHGRKARAIWSPNEPCQSSQAACEWCYHPWLATHWCP